MFIDWLSKKDLTDSDSAIIWGAAVVLFAGSVFILDEVFIWNFSVLSLIGMSVVAGGIGFIAAKISPFAIKAISPVVFFSTAALLSMEFYETYSLQKATSVFLAQTDHCKALGLQIINKDSWTPVCMERETVANEKSCRYVRDNEWLCNGYSHSAIIAIPEGHMKLPSAGN